MKKFLLILMVSLLGACTQKVGAIRDVTSVEAEGLLRNDFAVMVDASQPVEPSTLKKDKEVLLKNLPEGAAGDELVRKLSQSGYRIGRIKN